MLISLKLFLVLVIVLVVLSAVAAIAHVFVPDKAEDVLDYIRASWRSFTIKVSAVLMTVGTFLTFFLDQAYTMLPSLREYIPNEYFGTLMVALSAVMVALRFKTTKAVADR